MINISKPIISSREIKAVVKVLESGMIAQGPLVRKLEEEFCKYCDRKYAVAFNSGTAAIHAGLYVLGIKKGDEVITTPFTFVATANPITMLGARIIFADISEEDFNIDPLEVARKVTKKTKAIVPVDLYGQIYDFKSLNIVSKKNNLLILEDACQAIGASQNNAKAGNFGDVSAFSFYATKNLMCGEGGMLVTNNEEYADKCKMFRHHGQSEKTKYEYYDIGYNYRMTDIAASIAIEQLKSIDKLNNKRIKNAEKYAQGLSGIKGFILPVVKDENRHVFHQYTVRITENFKGSRDGLMEYLKEKGIGSGIYYPKPLHLHPHFIKMGYEKGDFPVAEKLSRQVLSLPVHPGLTSKNINFIIRIITEYNNKNIN